MQGIRRPATWSLRVPSGSQMFSERCISYAGNFESTFAPRATLALGIFRPRSVREPAPLRLHQCCARYEHAAGAKAKGCGRGHAFDSWQASAASLAVTSADPCIPAESLVRLKTCLPSTDGVLPPTNRAEPPQASDALPTNRGRKGGTGRREGHKNPDRRHTRPRPPTTRTFAHMASLHKRPQPPTTRGAFPLRRQLLNPKPDMTCARSITHSSRSSHVCALEPQHRCLCNPPPPSPPFLSLSLFSGLPERKIKRVP